MLIYIQLFEWRLQGNLLISFALSIRYRDTIKLNSIKQRKYDLRASLLEHVRQEKEVYVMIMKLIFSKVT